ncbi:MAG: MHS family MFS transporter [Xanthobacteraceae bacterium]|jgi:MHS family shikimate/dehydroshikimate transporter-like MFS transporter|nr:MHS family MFS transporter [Xanthobacteraceae bacterium]
MSQKTDGDIKVPNKVVVAGFISTFIEWYDFLVYGTVAALVFSQLFFPKLDAFAGTLAALSTFTVGFIARPLGGIVFGHFGDKIGRKKTLIVTLLMMAVATTGIGLLPTYDQIGIWAPIMLVVFRFFQGVSVGGEWGGVALLLMEKAAPSKRGFIGSWAQIGGYLGPLVGAGVLAVVTTFTTPQEFLAWGWRIPFLISILLFILGLWVRLVMGESHVFEKSKKAPVPIASLFRYDTKNVLGIMAVHGAQSLTLYIVIVFFAGFLKTGASFTAAQSTLSVVAYLIGATAASMFGGWLSDYTGRFKVVGAGLVLSILIAFPLFAAAATGNIYLVMLVTFTAGVACGLIYGPEPAYFGELFPTQYRYTGVSVGVQFGTLAAGSTAPIVGTFLLQWAGGGTWAVAAYLIGWQIIGLLGLMALGETRGKALEERPGA